MIEFFSNLPPNKSMFKNIYNFSMSDGTNQVRPRSDSLCDNHNAHRYAFHLLVCGCSSFCISAILNDFIFLPFEFLLSSFNCFARISCHFVSFRFFFFSFILFLLLYLCPFSRFLLLLLLPFRIRIQRIA